MNFRLFYRDRVRPHLLALGAAVSLAIGFVMMAYGAYAQTPTRVTVAAVPTLPPFNAKFDVTNVPFQVHDPGQKQNGANAPFALSGFMKNGSTIYAIIRHGNDSEDLFSRDQAVGDSHIELIDPTHNVVKLANGKVLPVVPDVGSVLTSPSPNNPYASPTPGGNP